MSDPITEKPEAIDELIETGSEIAGGAVGAAIGFFTGGPGGAIAGGAAGPFLSRAFRSIASEIGQRILGRREKERVGATIAYAAEKIKKNLAEGRQLRQDNFFETQPDGRSAVEEIIEGVLLVAQRAWEEKKLPFYGNLLANIAFDRDFSRSEANLLVRLGEQISYRQMCLLDLFAHKDRWQQLRWTDYKGSGALQWPIPAVLQEIFDLYARGMLDGGQTILHVYSEINPSLMNPQGSGGALYQLMELWNIDQRDVREVTTLLV